MIIDFSFSKYVQPLSKLKDLPVVLISGSLDVLDFAAFFLVFLTDFLTVFGASDTFSTGVISESPIKYSNFYTFHCGYKVFFLKKKTSVSYRYFFVESYV